MTARVLGAAAFAAGILLLLRGFGACSEENQAAGGPKSDAGTESHPDAAPEGAADAGPDHAPPPWDPVWHETKPATFTEVPPGPRRERPCGGPCKVIAETKPDASANRRPRANDNWAVFQVVPGGRVHAVRLDAGAEFIVDDAKGWPEGFGAGGISVSEDHVLYGVSTMWGGLIIIRSLLTGEAKVAWTYEDIPGLMNGTSTTAFAKPFAYWLYGPPEAVYRFDIRDGTLKSVPGGGCLILEGTSTGLASCSGEGFTEIIDFDAGKKKLGSTPSEDNTGGLSPDGKSGAWIDQRDPGPNGEIGNWFKPFGGEVYIKSMLTGVETRVTFDSPAKPVMKAFPRLVEGRLVWQSWLGTEPPENPDYVTAWQLPMPIWFSIDGSPPAPLMDPPTYLGFAQPIKTGVVGAWAAPLDGGALESHLVHIAWPKGSDGGSDAGNDP